MYEHFRDYFQHRGIQAALKVPLFLGDDLRGVLMMRFQYRRVFMPEEAELAFALGNQAVLALELTRLAEVAQSAAIMEERNRMARDIHDTLAQTFTSVLMRLQAASLVLAEPGGHLADAQANIERACELAREGLANTRRSVQALQPSALMDRTLPEALADYLQCMTDGTAVVPQFRVMGDLLTLSEETELELFRIAQEAVNNKLEVSSDFKRNLRTLAKRYRHIRSDLEPLLAQLQAGDCPGDQISGIAYTVFKVRLRNTRHSAE